MRKSDKKRVLNEVAQKLESAMDSSTPQEYYERLTRIDTDELLKNGYSGIAKQLHKLQDKCYDMQSEGFEDWGDIPERTAGLYSRIISIVDSIK